MRNISISPVLNGWVAKIGCQTVCFTDKTEMIGYLSAYIDDPEGVEKSFLMHAVNRSITMGGLDDGWPSPAGRGICI